MARSNRRNRDSAHPFNKTVHFDPPSSIVRIRVAARFFILLTLIVAVPILSAADDPPEFDLENYERPHYEISKARSPVKVDAVLDDEAWSASLQIDLPYEVMPGENTPAPVRTDCFVTYDENNFYVGFRAHDPDPSKIRARLADRDTPWRDDFVGFMFDPFNDERRGFEIFVNPLGVQMDLSRNDVGSGDPEDATWDAIWESAGRITDDGYIVEIALPFSSLRFPRANGSQTWGFMAFRAYPRNVRHQILSVPGNRNVNCFFCRAAKISGFEGITPGRNIEFDPTWTTLRTDTLETSPGSSMLSGDPDTDIGLSGRWGITTNLSLNVALNPDFSQVEADAAQLDVNNRFTLFYPEKRPFFLEGADLFVMPLQTVHTRSVVDPSVGLKLTGKEGGNAIGVYVTRDEENTLIFPSNQESDDTSLDQDVTSGVFRYRRDVGRNSTIGSFLTAREGDEYHNRVYGLDGHLRFSSRDQLGYQVLGSNTTYPDEIIDDFDQPRGTLNGYGLSATYVHSRRNFNIWSEFEDLSSNLRVDAGFVPRVDTRETEIGANYVFWGGAERWFSILDFGVEIERITDHDGRLTDRNIMFFSNYNGPMQSYFGFDVRRKKEFYDGTTYDLTTSWFHLNLQPTGQFEFWFTGNVGDAIDYDNSRPAKMLWGGPGMRYYFGRHLQVMYDNTLQELTVDGERLFLVNLNELRVVYQFNVQTYVRAILQYEDISRNVDLYDPDDEVEADSRELFSQLLFSYKINPQTVLFIGYSDNHDNEERGNLTMKDRTFFFKLGYAWVL